MLSAADCAAATTCTCSHALMAGLALLLAEEGEAACPQNYLPERFWRACRLSGQQLAALLEYCTSDLLDDDASMVAELAGVPVLLGDRRTVQLSPAGSARQQVFVLDQLEQQLVPQQSGLVLAGQHLPAELASRCSPQSALQALAVHCSEVRRPDSRCCTHGCSACAHTGHASVCAEQAMQ